MQLPRKSSRGHFSNEHTIKHKCNDRGINWRGDSRKKSAMDKAKAAQAELEKEKKLQLKRSEAAAKLAQARVEQDQQEKQKQREDIVKRIKSMAKRLRSIFLDWGKRRKQYLSKTF